MAEIENKGIPLPEKKKGEHKDIIAKDETATIEDAQKLFETVKKRLLDTNNWDKICGKASAVFRLTDESGNEVDGDAKVGHYFKINIPAPGSETGKGYDWVRVEAIEEEGDANEESQFIVMRARPSSNPKEASENIAHFFSDEATSNFVVLREKKKITAAVLGRNEIPNTSSSDSFFDKIRNALVGTGAVAGISNPQWKSLVNGLLGKD